MVIIRSYWWTEQGSIEVKLTIASEKSASIESTLLWRAVHLLTIAFETETASDLAHRRFLAPVEPGLFVKAVFDALMIFPLSCFSYFFLSKMSDGYFLPNMVFSIKNGLLGQKWYFWSKMVFLVKMVFFGQKWYFLVKNGIFGHIDRFLPNWSFSSQKGRFHISIALFSTI